MIKVDPPRPEVPPQDTIVDMVRTAAWRFARQEALVCGDQRLDWAAFDARINRVANDLLAHGVSKGDTIAILSPNSVAYAELFMGILRAGACVTPLSTMAAPDTLHKMLTDCGAKTLFLADQYRNLVQPFLAALDIRKVALDFQAGDFDDYEAALALAGCDDPMIPVAMSDPFNLIYSSGTTGTPKIGRASCRERV